MNHKGFRFHSVSCNIVSNHFFSPYNMLIHLYSFLRHFVHSFGHAYLFLVQFWKKLIFIRGFNDHCQSKVRCTLCDGAAILGVLRDGHLLVCRCKTLSRWHNMCTSHIRRAQWKPSQRGEPSGSDPLPPRAGHTH